MYASIDFKSKKQLIQAIKNGQVVTIYAPGLNTVPVTGKALVEGPHGHCKWSAQCDIENGRITRVK